VTTPLTAVDYVIIAAYLIGTLIVGAWIGRRIKSGADFFLAGRSLPWWAVGMSLVATDIGGTDIIGVGGAAYSHGLAVANFEWIGCVPAMIVAAFAFIPFFYRTGVYTVPEFLERRFDARIRSVLAACWLIFMACNLGVILLASAKMMSQTFGWDPVYCIWGIAVLVGFYTAFGGLAAVVYTDVMQCSVMIGGCLVVLVVGLKDVGGWSGLVDKLQRSPHHLELIVGVDAPSPFPWPAIVFGLAMVLSPAYWIGNQAIIQRSLGARSEYEAKASYVWGAMLKSIIPLIIAVPGLIAAVRYTDLSEGDAAFPRLVADLLPGGLRSVFIAGFLAALMSSVDSYLNSAATILCHDLYKRFLRPAATEADLLRVGRITTVLLIFVGIGFALAFLHGSEESGVYAIFQTLMAFFQGPARAVVVSGIFWRRATGTCVMVFFGCGIAT
jgi:SSS family solute:Na+ symporter